MPQCPTTRRANGRIWLCRAPGAQASTPSGDQCRRPELCSRTANPPNGSNRQSEATRHGGQAPVLRLRCMGNNHEAANRSPGRQGEGDDLDSGRSNHPDPRAPGVVRNRRRASPACLLQPNTLPLKRTAPAYAGLSRDGGFAVPVGRGHGGSVPKYQANVKKCLDLLV